MLCALCSVLCPLCPLPAHMPLETSPSRLISKVKSPLNPPKGDHIPALSYFRLCLVVYVPDQEGPRLRSARQTGVHRLKLP